MSNKINNENNNENWYNVCGKWWWMTFDSKETIAGEEYIMDCDGVLKVENWFKNEKVMETKEGDSYVINDSLVLDEEDEEDEEDEDEEDEEDEFESESELSEFEYREKEREMEREKERGVGNNRRYYN